MKEKKAMFDFGAIRKTIFLLLISLMSLQFVGVASTTGSRFLGFEDQLWDNAPSSFSLDSVVKHRGNAALKINGDLTAGTEQMVSDFIPINPKYGYEFSFWIKTLNISSANGIVVAIEEYDAARTKLGWFDWARDLYRTGETKDWEKIKKFYRSSRGTAAFIKVYLIIEDGVTGQAWFDNLIFEPGYVNTFNRENDTWGGEGTGFDANENHTPGGGGSLKLSGANTYNAGDYSIPVSREMDYELTAWIKTQEISSTNGVSVGILEYDASGKDKGWNWIPIKTGGTQDWHKKEVVIKGSEISTDTVSVKIFLRQDWGVNGTVWFDDVTFKALPKVRNFYPEQNVFSPNTGTATLNYELTKVAHGKLEVLNQKGEVITTPIVERALDQTGTFTWDGKVDGQSLAEGIYTLRLSIDREGQTDVALATIEIDTTGPQQPIITYPIANGETLHHNQEQLVLLGKVSGAESVKVFRRVSGEESEAGASVTPNAAGEFQLSATLIENEDNALWVVAYDVLGNPSEKSQELVINYDPQRPAGIISILNGDLLSPEDGNGVLDELKISFHLNMTGQLEFIITDESGKVVYSEVEVIEGATDIMKTWQGQDNDGNLVADGTYNYNLRIDDISLLAASLVMDNTAPPVPVLLYPLTETKITGIPEFSWEALADADYYLLTYGQDEDLSGKTAIKTLDSRYRPATLGAGIWYWQVVAVDKAGNTSTAKRGTFTITTLDTQTFDLVNFKLGPNPFSPNGDGRREQLQIAYTLQQEGRVQIRIYNLAGKLIQQIGGNQQAAGDHTLSWDGRDLEGKLVAPGAYLLRLEATNPLYEGAARESQLILVLK